ncbi:MAG: RDD family protein [Granulosicoccus sp.]
MQNSSSSLSMLFRRSAAFLYDCFLLIALFFVITAAVIALNDGQAIQHFLYKVFLFLVGFIFFDWFWRHGGQTLGMRAWRIRVEGKNTAVLTRKQSMKRYFWGVILFGITLLYLPISKRSEALHDTFSNTKIVFYNK